MRIVRLDAFALSAPVDVPVRSAVGSFSRRNSVVVRVETDEAVGYGESWINFPPWGLRGRLATILEGIGPLVLDERFSDPPELWRRIEPRLRRVGLQCGTIGELYQAYSGIDNALWDAAARAAGKPLYEMLHPYVQGPAAHPSTARAEPPAPELYASGLGPPNGLALAQDHLDRGFRRFKLKVGMEEVQDLENARAMRELIGPGCELLVDANQAWTADEAIAAIRRLEAFGIGWIEEPVAADDEAGYRRVRAHCRVPVAAGENFYGMGTWNRFLAEGLLSVAQPDVAKCGGLSAALDVVNLALRSGVRVVPHYLGGALGLLATLHLAAACPEPLLVEFDANPNPLRTELVEPALRVRAGRAILPAGAPGLGVDLSEGVVDRYRVS